MNRNDTALRLATLIQRQLQRHAQKTPRDLQDAVEHVLERQHMVQRAWQLLLKARERGWHAAARQGQGRLFEQARLLQERLTDMLHLEDQQGQTQPQTPALGLIVQELRQLQQEFETVELDCGGQLIASHTESIELEGVTLGPFKIELHIDKLGRRCDSGCFDLVATDPNPASSDDLVTHPHVRDKALCAGEATVPLAQALRQGRICDAFCIVQSVLKAYNSGSPYVQLSDWDGTSCPECGGSVDSDDLCRCTACDGLFCESCVGTCDICDESTCTACLERDPVTRRYCCPSCRFICNKCGRVVENDEFDDDNGLCPQCCPPEPGEEPSTENDHEHEECLTVSTDAAAPSTPSEVEMAAG